MRTERALLAELESAQALHRAVETLHGLGYTCMDAFTPHPMPELDALLGIPRSRTPLVVLAGGLFGGLFAFFLQCGLNGVSYPLNVGGRPLLSVPAFIPITFETTVLFAALSGFGAWLWVSRLPTLDDPVFAVEGFRSATLDRFWLAIATRDPVFELERTAEQLREAGALRVLLMPEDAA